MPPASPLQPSPFLDRLIRFLVPYFIDVCSDLDAARAEILETLASYGVRTRSEALNAAQIIAYGLSALDALHEVKTTEMSPSMRLRYRGCANNLNRSGNQNEQSLAKRLARDTPTAVEAVNDISETPLQEQILLVHAKLAACGIHVQSPFPETVPHDLPHMMPDPNQRSWNSAMMQQAPAT